MSKIYISKEVDPYFNVALEYQLFTEADEDNCLFLWQNQACVVIGRNQNAYAECDMEYLKKENILPVRRFSGGGAVFQDLGNLNFTFITKEAFAKPDEFIELAQRAVASLGVECSFSGRNDLLYEGKKISGHANYSEDDNYMYHGTMMVNVDLDKLTHVLKPSFIKLNSKGIDSVRSRVINLVEVNPNITIDLMRDALTEAFIDTYGETQPLQYVNKNNSKPPLWPKIEQHDWIFGEAPQFEIQVERRLAAGNVSIATQVENGLVTQIEIYSDSLLPVDFSLLKAQLLGILYEEDEIFKTIDDFLNNYQRQ